MFLVHDARVLASIDDRPISDVGLGLEVRMHVTLRFRCVF